MQPPPDRIDPPAIKIEAHAYRWVHGSDRDQVHLYDGSEQIGTWRFDTGEYYPFKEGKWTFPRTKPPTGAPPIPMQVPADRYYKGKGNPRPLPIPSKC